MNIPTLPGITAQTITTSRLTTRVLFSGPDDGAPVLLLHGNASCATWWEIVMVALPPQLRCIAPDLRGYGNADPAALIDATRGMGDLSADVVALLDTLGIQQAHIVGISMGGSVIWRLLREHPARFLTCTLINPGSPYGFGGSKDASGTPTYDDFAGSGGGLVAPDVVKHMTDPDLRMSSEHPVMSPRNRLRRLFVNAPVPFPHEEVWLQALLSTHMGAQAYPGDSVPSPNWPFVAPGVWGATNGLSRKYCGDVSALNAITPKPNILWLRGAKDTAVADQSLLDVGTLGKMGLIPGYPGEAVFPPQPMIAQTRAVLEQYAAHGGQYREVVLEHAGHVPYVDQPEAFLAALLEHLR